MKSEGSIKLREAAERLGVHYMTAYRYVRTGALSAEQRNGQWYVDAGDLASFATQRAEAPSHAGRPRAGSAKSAKRAFARSRRQAAALADRLKAGDQGGAWRLVESELDAGAGIRQINARLLTPALRDIGDQWEAGTASVADEHRATVVAMRLISRIGRNFVRPGRKRGTVILSAVPGDRHGLPSAIVADLLRAEGLEVVDLGADTPRVDLVAIAANQDRLIAVGLCATSPMGRSGEREIREAIREIRARTGRPVLLGGAAVTDTTAQRVAPDHRSHDADEAVDWFLDVTSSRSGAEVVPDT